MRSLVWMLTLAVLILSGGSLQSGSHGTDVAALQSLLDRGGGAAIATDGTYGPATTGAVSHYQQLNGLAVDGMAGPAVVGSLLRSLPERADLMEGSSGPAVTALQQLLAFHGAALAPTGVFGATTRAALTAFQKSQGLTTDGIAGPETLGALASLKLTVPQGATLSLYASRYGVPMGTLTATNHLATPNLLLAGSTITIPLWPETGVAAASSTTPAPAAASVQAVQAAHPEVPTAKADASVAPPAIHPSLSTTVPLIFVGSLPNTQAAHNLLALIGHLQATFFLPPSAPPAVVQYLRQRGQEVGAQGLPAPTSWHAHVVLLSPQQVGLAATVLRASMVPFIVPQSTAPPVLVGGSAAVVPLPKAPKWLPPMLARASALHLQFINMGQAYGLNPF